MFEASYQQAELCIIDYRIVVEYDLSLPRQCEIEKEIELCTEVGTQNPTHAKTPASRSDKAPLEWSLRRHVSALHLK